MTMGPAGDGCEPGTVNVVINYSLLSQPYPPDILALLSLSTDMLTLLNLWIS